ncbi:DUF3486 family protein [Neptunomonas japonica]|uniref:DUF3486 family protein n=1 Tax=Neptunomonas japonica TaxID=417574 RepID=UPI00040A6F6B|nr:DUF3486 family protein [Neptunomonas japonica]
MAEKRTRGRRSKIDVLPTDIKAALNSMLRDGQLDQQEILTIVNDYIEEAGLEDAAKLSRSGLNRYASKMEGMGARIRQLREVSEVWVAKLGTAPTSDVGKMLQEIVRTLATETGLAMSESDKPIEPKVLGQLALVAQRVEQAAMASHKRETEIRTAFAEEAANAMEEVAKSQGLTRDGVKAIKQQILGIV